MSNVEPAFIFPFLAAAIYFGARFGRRVPCTKPRTPWITRRVERELARRLDAGSVVMHVCGRRRIGKTTTVERLAIASGRTFLKFSCVHGFEQLLQDLNDSLHLNVDVQRPCSVARAFAEYLQQNLRIVVAIDKLQCASKHGEGFLQYVIDILTSAHDVSNVKHASLVLLGSFESFELLRGDRPLYMRFSCHFAILPLHPEELSDALRQHRVCTDVIQHLYDTPGGAI